MFPLILHAKSLFRENSIKHLTLQKLMNFLTLSLLPFLAGIWLVFTGAPFWWLLLSVVIAVVIFVFVRSYVELVRVMIDMLLPK